MSEVAVDAGAWPEMQGAPALPAGRHLDLPGRGTTFVREIPGPPNAPTLLLLHGLAATADLNWLFAYDALAPRFRVVAIDHRGHGRGIRPRGPFRLRDCADDVAAVCEALDIESAIAVGYSMGGPIAQLLWRRHPHLVRGLVLCATSRNFRGHPRDRLMFASLPFVTFASRMVTPAIARSAIAGALAVRRGHPASLRAWVRQEIALCSPRLVAEAAAEVGRFSSHDWVDEIDVPAAVVATMRDDLVPPRRQLKLARVIPGATLHPVEATHLAPFQDPDVLLEGLTAAIDSVIRRV